MATADHQRLIRRLKTIGELGEEECALIGALPMYQKRFNENADIVRQGDKPTECVLILDGLAGRYILASGGRQILSLHFSGDMPDLQGLHLSVMDHGIFAMTPVRAAFIPHDAVRAIIRANDRIADVLVADMLIDAAIFRQWITNVGRRDAFARISHVFCEVFVRMRTLGLVQQDSFRLPMTQTEIGDATGLSPVHVNRVLQRMRREGLIVSKGDVHSIASWERLREAADFNEDYLHLRGEVSNGA